MAITNFISTVWSENLYRELDKQYVAAANCNRDYEGEIREQGSSVKICGLEPVSISDYRKNTDIVAPMQLSDNVRELVINQAKYFNFAIDDIDRAQTSPKLMELAIKNAASALADAADKLILQTCAFDSGSQISASSVTADTILDYFFEARTKLAENNAVDPDDIIFEISPKIAEMVMKAKIDLGNTNDIMEKGYIGNIAGCKVFVSNNIYKLPEPDGTCMHRCIARTKRSVAFAEQLSEIEAYRPESRFADAVKGLHLYGTKVVYPNEVVCLTFTV